MKKGDKCQDINECLNNVCSGIFECSNTDGSYACNCPIGYDMIDDVCTVMDFFILDQFHDVIFKGGHT